VESFEEVSSPSTAPVPSCANSTSLRRVPGKSHHEQHHHDRIGWLRAAVLGADDGIVSTASLMIGVASASSARGAVLIAGVAGLVAGALSMAAGEYVSVSSQRDSERADIAVEKEELAESPRAELRELAMFYEKRGLDSELAMKVAVQLSEKDRLGAHLRDELHLDAKDLSRPWQAAASSAASFAAAALIPIVAVLVTPASLRGVTITASSLIALAGLGAAGGYAGGAPMGKAALRVVIGGGFAMAVSALVGKLLGVVGV
jgi:VIT1/CCC1 family predicted Fe2+/Mn2+ transporter